jgi:hypothetical protein
MLDLRAGRNLHGELVCRHTLILGYFLNGQNYIYSFQRTFDYDFGWEFVISEAFVGGIRYLTLEVSLGVIHILVGWQEVVAMEGDDADGFVSAAPVGSVAGDVEDVFRH